VARGGSGSTGECTAKAVTPAPVEFSSASDHYFLQRTRRISANVIQIHNDREGTFVADHCFAARTQVRYLIN